MNDNQCIKRTILLGLFPPRTETYWGPKKDINQKVRHYFRKVACEVLAVVVVLGVMWGIIGMIARLI